MVPHGYSFEMAYPSRPLVIMPTYNERENVGPLISAILEQDDRLHVLVVDDASPDGTAVEVLRLKDRLAASRISLLAQPAKSGLGNAYVQGFRWGLEFGYDFMLQMDGDWSHNPCYLDRMLQLAREFDLVIGSRYVSGGGTLNWGVGRKLLSKFASIYSRLVLGVHFSDFTGGFNGWSARLLSDIHLDDLKSDGYSFQIEMKYRASRLGCRHIEFPIIFDERRAGKSKMSMAIAWEAGWRLWLLRLIGR